MSEAEEVQVEGDVHQSLEKFPDGLHVALRLGLQLAESTLSHQRVWPAGQQAQVDS